MKRDAFTMPLDTKRTRSIWRTMRARCEKPSHVSYPNYGALGVTVCDRWQTFENFLADMGVAPEGMSIDRHDSTGAYAPGNCSWATPKQQARNRSNNVHITFAGESLTIAEWAERYGMKVGTLWRRLQTGVSIQAALTRDLCRGKPMTGKQKPRSVSK